MNNCVIDLKGLTYERFKLIQQKCFHGGSLWQSTGKVIEGNNDDFEYLEIGDTRMKYLFNVDQSEYPLVSATEFLGDKGDAKRYNTGKVELSHVLDFSESFKKLYGDSHGAGGGMDMLVDHSLKPLPNQILTVMAELELDLGGSGDFMSVTGMHSMRDMFIYFPRAIDEFCRVCMNGAMKYDRGNFKKGFPEYTLIDSALRHYSKWCQGFKYDVPDVNQKIVDEYFDGDTKVYIKQFATHHLAHVMWNLMVKFDES